MSGTTGSVVSSDGPVVVAAFSGMDEATAIRHLEARHSHQLFKLRFAPEGDPLRRLNAGLANWSAFHDYAHARDAMEDHTHEDLP